MVAMGLCSGSFFAVYQCGTLAGFWPYMSVPKDSIRAGHLTVRIRELALGRTV
jgi:hypothetical protein